MLLLLLIYSDNMDTDLEKEVEKLYKDSFDDIKHKISELYAEKDLVKKDIEEHEKKQPEPEVEAKKEDEQYHFKKEGDKLICTDNNCNLSGAELEVGSDAKSLLNNLNNIYHKETHDFLSCSKCRPQFDEIVEKSGYKIKENKNEIILIKKK